MFNRAEYMKKYNKNKKDGKTSNKPDKETNDDMKEKVEEKEKVDAIDLEIEDVPGIGPTKAKQLRENEITSVFDLASTQMDDLAIALGVSKETAGSFINEANKLLRKTGFLNDEWTKATVLYEKRQAVKKIKTGSTALDKVLGGGIETRAVTEFYGEFGSGKSQICFSACVNVQKPVEEGGLGGNALFIDTEQTFMGDRVWQIAETKGMDPKNVCDNITVAQVYNSGHLELLVKNIGQYITRFNAKLVVIDSITSHFRADYVGRGTLADRQGRLNQIMHKLVRVASIFEVAIIVTNQVMSAPDVMFGPTTKPVGGHVLGHASTYRLELKKSGKNRIAYMIDSPGHPYASEKFTVTEAGIVDAEEEKKKNAT